MINIHFQVEESSARFGSVLGENGNIQFEVGADCCTLTFGERIIESKKHTTSFWFCYHSDSQVAALGRYPPTEKIGHSIILILTHVALVHPILDLQNVKIISEISPPKLFLSYKFNFDHSYKSFLGNTIVANLFKNSEEVKKLAQVQDKLKESAVGYAFRYIDPENFHVTLLNLLHERMYQTWLEKNNLMHLHGDWEKINGFFYNRLRSAMEQFADARVELKFEAIHYSPFHFVAIFVPANEDSAKLLAQMKRVFQEASGISSSVVVPLHVTLGYKLYPFMPHAISPTDQIVHQLENHLKTFSFVLDKPFFATFKDMSTFLPFQ